MLLQESLASPSPRSRNGDDRQSLADASRIAREIPESGLVSVWGGDVREAARKDRLSNRVSGKMQARDY